MKLKVESGSLAICKKFFSSDTSFGSFANLKHLKKINKEEICLTSLYRQSFLFQPSILV